MPELLLRAGATDVTPSRPGELAGYAARAGALSTGAHDPLEAALVVLDDGAHRTGWLALDAIGVSADLAALLRDAVRAGLGDDGLRLVVAASHTHSAPLGWVGSIHPGHPGAVDPDGVAELVGRVGELAARLAERPAEPVLASWGAAAASGLGANRLDPSLPHDDSIGVLALRSADGTARALVVDAATHPTVLGPDNLRWSADWPGALRAALRASPDGEPVIAFLQGAAGDVSTRFTRRGSGFDEVTRLGRIAATTVRAATGTPGMPLAGPVRYAARLLELERRALPAPAEAERELVAATAARDELRLLPDLDPRVRIAQARLDGAVVQRGLVAAAPDGSVILPVSVLALGDVAWAHVPVELFASVGARVRAGSPFPVTRVVGYADAYRGYLVDRPAVERGSYEALSTFFPPAAGDALAAALHDLLEELR